MFAGFTSNETVPEEGMKLVELIEESLHIVASHFKRWNGVHIIWSAANR
jgi:hypothetical protein